MTTDHETVGLKEGAEKLARGIRLLIREGSSEKNLAELVPLLNDYTLPHLSLACDDRTALDLVRNGHMDYTVRRAVQEGVDPMKAVVMATLNTARHYGLEGKGAVAPGYFADLACVGSVREVNVKSVFHRGKLVARDGALTGDFPSETPEFVFNSVKVPEISTASIRVPARGSMADVIELVPGQIITVKGKGSPSVVDGGHVSNTDEDVLKLVVMERHTGLGGVSVGFARGFGLKSGAMASSIAHDSHNLIAVGVADYDIVAALKALADSQGGLSFADNGTVEALLPLPVAGLMSNLPPHEVCSSIDELRKAAKKRGCGLDAPYAALSFLALPVIPEIRLTDRGLVDVLTQSFIG
jgi:adenine deaminase